MSVIAAALKHMLAAGMKPEAIVAAVEEMEAAAKPARSSGAERQARYRAAQKAKAAARDKGDGCDGGDASDVTRDALSEEPSKPDTFFPSEQVSPHSPPTGAHSPPPRQRPDRGHRLPEDWQPTEEDRAVALAELGDEGAVEREILKFRDYWSSRAGKDARKTNWSATFRNWCRNSYDGSKRTGRNGTGTPSRYHDGRPRGFDAVLAGVARVAHQRGLTEPGGDAGVDAPAGDPGVVDADWWAADGDRGSMRATGAHGRGGS